MKKEIKITIGIHPVTKKNSQRIIRHGNGFRVIPSKAYVKYEKECAAFLLGKRYEIKEPVNVKAVYYRKDKRRVDLCNLHEALCDVLVKYSVVTDDNCNIIQTMDGSRVKYDKENPRTEITITPAQNEKKEEKRRKNVNE